VCVNCGAKTISVEDTSQAVSAGEADAGVGAGPQIMMAVTATTVTSFLITALPDRPARQQSNPRSTGDVRSSLAAA
jgi:hypothetical protein